MVVRLFYIGSMCVYPQNFWKIEDPVADPPLQSLKGSSLWPMEMTGWIYSDTCVLLLTFWLEACAWA